MKRVILAVAALLSVASIALASGAAVAPKLTVAPIYFRSNRSSANLPTGLPVWQYAAGFVDSSTYVRAGSGTADTTEAISLLGLALPFDGAGAAAASDSVSLAKIVLSDAGATASNDPPQLTAVQVSSDGVNWATSLTFFPATRLFESLSANKVYVIHLESHVCADKLDEVLEWPYIRLIISNKASASAVSNFRGTITYFSSNSDANQ